MRALVVVRCLLVLAVALMSACASTPKTTMLVPSRTTTAELERLSRKAGTTVDVLTVSREERQLLLDGSGGDALTGHAADATVDAKGAKQVVRIPFDDLALVYYRADGLPSKEKYPELPRVRAHEQRLSCEDLAVDLGRAEAIRWFAREQGGTPFTQHEAGAKHAAKAGIITGLVLASPLLIAFSPYALQGLGSASLPAAIPVTLEEYRWAVTATDRRELGLLELKRDRQCAPRETGTEAGSDLTILERIESSRRQLAAKQITASEQMGQQTRLLDQLSPAPPQTHALVTVENIQETAEVPPAELR